MLDIAKWMELPRNRFMVDDSSLMQDAISPAETQKDGENDIVIFTCFWLVTA